MSTYEEQLDELNQACIGVENLTLILENIEALQDVVETEGPCVGVMATLEGYIGEAGLDDRYYSEENPPLTYMQLPSGHMREVALESFSDISSGIFTLIQENIGKILTLVMVIVGVIIRLLSNGVDNFYTLGYVKPDELDDIREAYAEAENDPEYSFKSLGISVSVLNNLINDANRRYQTPLAQLIISSQQGYTDGDIITTSEKVVNLITEEIMKGNKTFGIVEDILTNITIDVQLKSQLGELEDIYLENDMHLARYTLPTLLKSIEREGGKVPTGVDSIIKKDTQDVVASTTKQKPFWKTKVYLRGTNTQAKTINYPALYMGNSEIDPQGPTFDINVVNLESKTALLAGIKKLEKMEKGLKREEKELTKRNKLFIEKSNSWIKQRFERIDEQSDEVGARIVYPTVGSTSNLSKNNVFTNLSIGKVLATSSLLKTYIARISFLTKPLTDVKRLLEYKLEMNNAVLNIHKERKGILSQYKKKRKALEG